MGGQSLLFHSRSMGGGMFLYPSKTPSGSHCPASGGLIVWDRGLCDGSDEPAPMVRTGRISAVFTGGWGGLAGERKSRQRYLAGFVAGSGVKSPAGPNWRQRPHSDRNGRTERFPCCAWNVGWHLCRALSVFSRSELAGSCSVRLCVHGAN